MPTFLMAGNMSFYLLSKGLLTTVYISGTATVGRGTEKNKRIRQTRFHSLKMPPPNEGNKSTYVFTLDIHYV